MFEMKQQLFLILPGLMIISGLLGSKLAARKRRDAVLWFLLCVIFPPIIIFLSGLKTIKLERHEIIQCPFCRGFIKWDAASCKICGKSLREPLFEIVSPNESEKPFTI